MKRMLYSCLLLSLFAGVANADFTGTNDADVGFIDNAKVGSSIDVGVSETITDVEVTIDMNHTWVGDLIVRLEAPDGTALDLIHRTGFAGGGKGGCCGDSSNLGGTYTFSDDGDTSWWATAGALGGDAVMPSGDWAPTGADGVLGSFAATFGGLDTEGTWTLSLGDWAGGDTGAVTSWTLNIVSSGSAIPEPTTAGLLAIGLAGFVARRRR